MRTLVVMTLLAAFAVGAGAQVSGASQPSYQPKSATDKAHSDAEFTTIAYLRTVAYAQRLYFRKHQQYPASLAGLVGTGSFTRRMAVANRGDYTVTYRTPHDGYAVVMTPKTFDPGHRSFYVDESGEIRVEDAKPATKESQILRAQE